MKRKKDLGKIIAGYKGNHKFQKDQLSKILNLDSYHSYISINLFNPDCELLLDKVLPECMDKLSSSFPFVVIRSASFNYIEITIVDVRNYNEIFVSIKSVENWLRCHFPGTLFN